MKESIEEKAEEAVDKLLIDPNYVQDYPDREFVRGFIAGYSEATKWVDCKERLPEYDKDVLLLFCDNEQISVGKLVEIEYGTPRYKRHWKTDASYHFLDYKSWMPLPPPPKDLEDGSNNLH